MITLLFNIILTNSIIFSFGTLLSIIFFNKKASKENISELPIFGVIFLSFITLIINFFFPINKLVGTLILIFGLLFFIKIIINNLYNNKKILKNIFISSVISFLILLYSNIYRPDAGLYHLPFISIINENKIIIGLANIHFRFATTSIVQYLSASQNNYIYNLEAISIPLASIFSFSIIFFVREIFKNIKKKKNINSILIFLISIFCLLGFGRFSNYGNDAISHLYFFTLIIFITNNYYSLKLDSIKLNKISLISIFLFTTKAFMFLVILIPFWFFLFLKNKKELFKNKFFYLNCIFLLTWMLKSILISGCIIYPIDKTCFKNLKIYDDKKIVMEAKSGEAWAKGWSDQKDIKLNFDDYNQNFNWMSTWKKVHLKKVVEKLLPFMIFLIIFFIVLIIQDKSHYDKLPNEINFIFFTSIFLTLIWFLKFPLYRYGVAFIATAIMVIFIYLIYFFQLTPKANNLLKNFKVFICICVIVFITKNFLRINKNLFQFSNSMWPDIYSVKDDYKLIKGDDKEDLYYFSFGELCMYSKSPCSHYDIKNLNKELFFSYDLYWIN